MVYKLNSLKRNLIKVEKICKVTFNVSLAALYGPLTLNLLTTTIVVPPSNASKRQMGFNSAFKGLIPNMPLASVQLTVVSAF